MKISIGADHRGFLLKQELIKSYPAIEWIDVGTHDCQRTDYPVYAQRVCQTIIDNSCQQGILICGSGIGISIAANRNKGIYAALCWNEQVATVAKEHDGANVLVLPADFISVTQACAIVDAWLKNLFKGGIYQQRLLLIDS